VGYTADDEPLAAGTAFVDLTSWRKIAVSGSDATTWLNDLVSADIGALGEGEARRSLLLSPTGQIRAEFTVALQPDATLLLQDPAQPASIHDLLARYVLSSDVRLEDRTDACMLLAVPGATPASIALAGDAAAVAAATPSAPSCVGAGVDLLGPVASHDVLIDAMSSDFERVDAAALDAWRVAAGVPRFGVDALEGDLPQEGGFGDAVAFDKGCYLGQEAMAKVRNLGHPRRMLLRLEADRAVHAGDAVESGGRVVGAITSAAATGGGWSVLAKVRWDARDAPLTARSSEGSTILAARRPDDGGPRG
jgi:folate-binding protein YgfZ